MMPRPHLLPIITEYLIIVSAFLNFETPRIIKIFSCPFSMYFNFNKYSMYHKGFHLRNENI